MIEVVVVHLYPVRAEVQHLDIVEVGERVDRNLAQEVVGKGKLHQVAQAYDN